MSADAEELQVAAEELGGHARASFKFEMVVNDFQEKRMFVLKISTKCGIVLIYSIVFFHYDSKIRMTYGRI